jgi:hypothetical protein
VLSSYLAGDALQPVPADVVATLRFGPDGSLQGTTSCNSFIGTATVDSPLLSIGGVMGSFDECPTAAHDEVEAALLAALARAAAYTANDSDLTIVGPDGRIVLTFVAGEPLASPPPASEAPASIPPASEPPPSLAPSAEPTPEPTPTPTPKGRQARITDIRVRGGRYVVQYEVFNYRQQLPGRHVHFFFDSVPVRDAGVPGDGPWILYAGPSPFREYRESDRPRGATQMCILVANEDHSINRGTGNCVDLP